jgi:hypothetical protein
MRWFALFLLLPLPLFAETEAQEPETCMSAALALKTSSAYLYDQLKISHFNDKGPAAQRQYLLDPTIDGRLELAQQALQHARDVCRQQREGTSVPAPPNATP